MTAPEQPQEKRIGTGISDAALLRALAEDVPDMALEVREQLRDIADYLGDEVYETSDAVKAECASTNPTMSIPVRGESPAPSASDPSQEPRAGVVEAMHASAPQGYKCADCTIDNEPCPTCYRAWWQRRHPNHVEV